MVALDSVDKQKLDARGAMSVKERHTIRADAGAAGAATSDVQTRRGSRSGRLVERWIPLEIRGRVRYAMIR